MLQSTSLRLRKEIAALAIPVVLLPALAFAQPATGFNQNGAGPYDYNLAGNWVNSTINGIWGADLTIASTQGLTFGADTVLSTGFDINYAGSGNLNFTGSGANRTITLGGDINLNTATARTINFGSGTAGQNLNVDLGGQTRNFTVGASRVLGFINTVSNGGLNLSGGNINFSGANTYSGATVINSGAVGFNGNAGSAANSDVTIKANSAFTTTLTFGGGGTANGSGITRAKSITLDGSNSAGTNTAILSVSGNATNNTVETITGNLTVANGYGIVSLSPNAGKNTRLNADAFVRTNSGVAFFRGTNLGLNTVASATANSSNITFTNAPTLTGAGGAAGTSTVSILKGAYGDTTNAGTGSGLVTYDSTYGVRLLTASEYTNSITDGQTQLDNARIVGDGATKTVTLNATTTTVNSLSLIQGAATGGNDGVLVTGTGTLKVNSGVIFNTYNTNTGNSGDVVHINTAKLDFNNQEAIITSVGSSSSGGGNLSISSEIINASSLVKSGNAVLKITGTTANTYTGDTIVNGGGLELGKTAGVNAIGGNLVVNAGTVVLTNANQIDDSKDVTVNGGTMNFAAVGVNGRDETIRNLNATGGTTNTGTTSGNTITTVNATDATLTGGTINVSRKSSLVLSGGLSVSNGATINVERYQTTNTTQKTSLSIGSGGLAITQTASGAYTPISLHGGNAAGVKGGELILNGDVTFTGNGTNTNTTTITTVAATSGGGEGLILLNGNRTFTIGDGAASTDLAIQASIVNGDVTGGLVKAGLGTLRFDAANTYTGATTVDAGTLLLGGNERISDSSALVLNGGTFATGGFSETFGTLDVNANATIDFGTGPGNSALVFADSSDVTWGASVSLSIINFNEGDSIRFGIDETGLDVLTQLGKITINGSAVAIDQDGYLSIVPEPSTYAAFAGVGALFLALRRRSRAS